MEKTDNNPGLRQNQKTEKWQWFALAAIILFAVLMDFYRLTQEGYANLYYAAAVKSMLTSWHNFFFVSFDSAGFVSVDKPPLGLWIQTISAMLFGFKGWSLLLPQALAGVFSVIVLYFLVRRFFGANAGLIAALLLAVTPISVVANRNNTMDSQLLFVLLLAAYFLVLAVERGKLGWLLLAMALVGIGFNIKMLQAYMVLPAFFVLFLFAARTSWWRRFLYLGIAAVLLLVISLSWAFVVDNTPADQRPYVGSSSDNTVMELILGHNGASRLGSILAVVGVEYRRPGPPPENSNPAAVNPKSSRNMLKDETGEPGISRLFNHQLAGQISWFFPFALLSLLVIVLQSRLKFPLNKMHQFALFWGTWLISQAVFFSYAGLFHRYYLTMMAPAIAALSGGGLVCMVADYRKNGWKGWLLPVGVLLLGLTETFILASFPEYGKWFIPIVLSVSLLTTFSLVLLRFRKDHKGRILNGLLIAGFAVSLLPLAVWAFIPVWHGGNAWLPFAGPDVLEKPLNDNQIGDIDKTISFLAMHKDGEKFLAATLDARTASPMILKTGEPVMALGGFIGGDKILSVDELEAMVLNREIRFFFLPLEQKDLAKNRKLPQGIKPQNSVPPPPGDLGKQSEIQHWVKSNCSLVPVRFWLAPPEKDSEVKFNPYAELGLWDCRLEEPVQSRQ